VTGLAAIGRGHEFNRNRELFAFLAQEIMPLVPEIGQYLIPRNILERGAIGLGVPIDGLVKTDEQIQQELADAQQAEMQKSMIDGAAPHIGEMATQEMGGQVLAAADEETPEA
jgi:hypothetical protein